VLLHEAIGHGIEADFNRRGTSKFTEKLGKPVGSSIVTISDTAVIPNHWGSLNVDDEGGEGHETRLVENGVLVSYMYDRYNSSLMGLAAGGNSRRENYRCTPMPRMTNTVMANGPHTFEEIVASVKKGFYAADFTGGQVDITNGQFVFSVSEGYLVEDGKITSPVKGATLIGDGADVLGKITMVADDFKLSFGGCGKNGQYVPVGLGQPHLLVSSMTVGGTRG
jgi:TldD protein